MPNLYCVAVIQDRTALVKIDRSVFIYKPGVDKVVRAVITAGHLDGECVVG